MASTGMATEAEAANIMLADHNDDIDASLAHAHNLVLAHLGSVAAHHLLGKLQYAAAVRAACGKGNSEDHFAAMAPHLHVALEVLPALHHLTLDYINIGPPFYYPAASARSRATARRRQGWGLAAMQLIEAGAWA